MKNKKIPFLIFVVLVCTMLFVNSCLSDTRVNSSLGLLKKFEDIADKNGAELDYDNYNEAFVAAYLKAVYDEDAVNLNKEQLSNQFNNLFYKKDGKFATKYIGNILEDLNIDREVKNKIDHYYYGEISTLAVDKSKGFYISQNNQKYYELPYSGDTMHVSGCGPISITMALNMLSGKSVYDAETVALWAKNHGYMDPTSGTIWSFIKDFPDVQGFDADAVSITSVDDLDKCFKDGAVIVTVMGKGVFTDEGHFIVLAGLDSENKVQVVDPMSIYRTNKNWPAEQMIKESKGSFWAIKR